MGLLLGGRGEGGGGRRVRCRALTQGMQCNNTHKGTIIKKHPAPSLLLLTHPPTSCRLRISL